MNRQKIFDNGLRLVSAKIDGMYSVAVGVWVGAGSSDETPKNNGISHFIEHMLFKGTEKRTAFEITDLVDRIGGQINAFTSKECTCYYTKTTSEYVEDSFDILSDMLFNSKFADEEIEKEKGVVLEEISMVEDTPEDICIDMLSEAYFGKHPLSKTIIGPSDNIRAFTRQDILDYMGSQYTPHNIVISVAGNIDVDEVEKLTAKYFATGFASDKPQIDRAVKTSGKGKFKHKFKEIEQSHIAICFDSVHFGSEAIEKNLIMCNILGGGMSSRLFQTVREKLGLAYSVYSYISTYKNNGMLTIYAGVNPKNVKKCVDAIREEVDKLMENGITEDEFQRGKAQLKGTFIMSQEMTSAVMNANGKYLLMAGSAFDMDKKIAAIDSVTIEDVNGCIKDAFNFDTASASYVGAKADECDVLKLFKGK